MAEFGWAYVAGDVISGALGPTGSVLLKRSSTEISGSPNLIYNTTSDVLAVAGGVSASVNISASAFYGDGSNLSNVGSELIVKEEGSNITTAATSINFVGAFVTASNSGNDVTVTINAGADLIAFTTGSGGLYAAFSTF